MSRPCGPRTDCWSSWGVWRSPASLRQAQRTSASWCSTPPTLRTASRSRPIRFCWPGRLPTPSRMSAAARESEGPACAPHRHRAQPRRRARDARPPRAGAGPRQPRTGSATVRPHRGHPLTLPASQRVLRSLEVAGLRPALRMPRREELLSGDQFIEAIEQLSITRDGNLVLGTRIARRDDEISCRSGNNHPPPRRDDEEVALAGVLEVLSQSILQLWTDA